MARHLYHQAMIFLAHEKVSQSDRLFPLLGAIENVRTVCRRAMARQPYHLAMIFQPHEKVSRSATFIVMM